MLMEVDEAPCHTLRYDIEFHYIHDTHLLVYYADTPIFIISLSMPLILSMIFF